MSEKTKHSEQIIGIFFSDRIYYCMYEINNMLII